MQEIVLGMHNNIIIYTNNSLWCLFRPEACLLFDREVYHLDILPKTDKPQA